MRCSNYAEVQFQRLKTFCLGRRKCLLVISWRFVVILYLVQLFSHHFHNLS